MNNLISQNKDDNYIKSDPFDIIFNLDSNKSFYEFNFLNEEEIDNNKHIFDQIDFN